MWFAFVEESVVKVRNLVLKFLLVKNKIMQIIDKFGDFAEHIRMLTNNIIAFYIQQKVEYNA